MSVSTLLFLLLQMKPVSYAVTYAVTFSRSGRELANTDECGVLSGEKSTVTIEPEWAYGRKGKPEVTSEQSIPRLVGLLLTYWRVPGGHRAQCDTNLRHGAGGHSLKPPSACAHGWSGSADPKQCNFAGFIGTDFEKASNK